jgi:hypothetical protein
MQRGDCSCGFPSQHQHLRCQNRPTSYINITARRWKTYLPAGESSRTGRVARLLSSVRSWVKLIIYLCRLLIVKEYKNLLYSNTPTRSRIYYAFDGVSIEDDHGLTDQWIHEWAVPHHDPSTVFWSMNRWNASRTAPPLESILPNSNPVSEFVYIYSCLHIWWHYCARHIAMKHPV